MYGVFVFDGNLEQRMYRAVANQVADLVPARRFGFALDVSALGQDRLRFLSRIGDGREAFVNLDASPFPAGHDKVPEDRPARQQPTRTAIPDGAPVRGFGCGVAVDLSVLSGDAGELTVPCSPFPVPSWTTRHGPTFRRPT